MNKIKFGTDGWRAIIAEDFTVQNVERVSMATAIWLKNNFDKPSVTLGNDCRFAGKLFIDAVAADNWSTLLDNEPPPAPPTDELNAKIDADTFVILSANNRPLY